MRPISSLSLLKFKRLENPMLTLFMSARFMNSQSFGFKSISSQVLKPAILTSLLGLSVVTMSAQAAINNNGKINNNKNPTSSLQLISLNADDVPLDNGADDFSDIADMLESADQVDDSIDAVADESVLDTGSDAINTDIPNEVAQVSLNAISP